MPLHCFGRIGGNAASGGIEMGGAVLGDRVAVARRLVEPILAALGIGSAKLAVEIDLGKRILGIGVVLVGGLGEPVDGLIDIGFDTLALLVDEAHHHHGADIAGLGLGFGDL